MTSSRPYLLRATYEWLNDNQMTSYLLVDAEKNGVMVPRQHVQEGKITLDISPMAITNLMLENGFVSFNARFSGKPMDIYIPMSAVIALYAMENGKGMVFQEEDDSNFEQSEAPSSPDEKEASSSDDSKPKKKPSFLKVVE